MFVILAQGRYTYHFNSEIHDQGMILVRNLVNDFVTLFVAIDAVGTVPLLMGLTATMSDAERKAIVHRGVLIGGIVLAGFALFGHLLLSSMGVTFASFRIAGGIILFMVGMRMVFDDHASSIKPPHKESGRDIAVFPLALPYIAGPGTMLAVMVATQQQEFDPMVLAAKIGVLALALVTTLVILLSSAPIHKFLGRTGSEVIGRVMGIILAALAAESVVRGVLEAFGRRSF